MEVEDTGSGSFRPPCPSPQVTRAASLLTSTSIGLNQLSLFFTLSLEMLHRVSSQQSKIYCLATRVPLNFPEKLRYCRLQIYFQPSVAVGGLLRPLEMNVVIALDFALAK